MGGFVSIVGAGPWDPQLLTLAGRDRLRRADVVIADYLVNPNLLLHAPPAATIIERVAGPRGGTTLPQPELNRLMVEHAQAGKRVVRLKGGDPCMFGRGGEEAAVLHEHDIAFEFIPGVTSPVAAPEAAGIPVTHRDHTPAVTFVSGYEAYEKAGLSVAWEHLARSAGTIVLMMSIRSARLNATRLIEAGRDRATPAAVVRWGTRGIQRTVTGQLHDIADRIEAEGIRAPAILVVGEVVDLRSKLSWVEQRPLFGRRVVVTRSRHQYGPLADALGAQGADVVAVPCLEVLPPSDPQALRHALAQLPDAYDGVILTSPNGVGALFSGLLELGMDLRQLAGKTLAVVGTGTASACRARGIQPELCAQPAHAEGLVATLRDNRLLGRRWLHVRADTGRDVLGPAITGAKGHYTLATGYRTVRPQVAPMALRSLLPPEDGGEGFDAICFASGKTAQHFLDTLGEICGRPRAEALLTQAAIISIGPVTTHALERLGLCVSQTATAPNIESMVEAVMRAMARK